MSMTSLRSVRCTSRVYTRHRPFPICAHLARAHQSPSPSITRTYQIPRPHLKPLDLAASPPNSSAPYPTPSTPTSKSRPLTRPANLLTPPLTPSSSFGDSSSGSTHTNGFGTSPQFSGSPSARWRRSMASHGQTTPSTDRSRSLDHDPTIDTSGDVDDNLVATLQSSLSLEEGNKASSTTPSRFLLITHVPKILEAESLKALFAPFRDGINRMNIKLQAEYGVVILAFYDEKEAEKAKARIGGLSVKSAFPTQCQRGLGRDQKNGPFNECGREGAETGEGKLGVGYVSAAKLRQLIGESGFADEVERQAEFYLSIDSAPEVSKGISVDMSKVTNTLGSFGALKSFDRDNGLSGEVYRVEFYDIRHAADAFDGFIKRAGFGRRIRLSRQKPGSFYDDHTPRSPRSPLPSPKSTLKEFGESTPSTSAVRLPSDPLARVKAMSMSEDPKGDAARAAKSLPLNSDLSRRRSNYDVFESGERRENGPTVEGDRLATLTSILLLVPSTSHSCHPPVRYIHPRQRRSSTLPLPKTGYMRPALLLPLLTTRLREACITITHPSRMFRFCRGICSLPMGIDLNSK
ncbi:hypothetical protein JAAARDRAFT_430277 [Jaapia argillacea MUCL 33604]|uniref:RRM domain-containing protein n=1 Tax=Jaapia argillacea MUCL 33604 TaxID=933084 RepID=A0A067PIF4_9AGAM|nr:hypothetical protein JAAARDRAFT_430277 [Jaapia argillacea MUCL 33604]